MGIVKLLVAVIAALAAHTNCRVKTAVKAPAAAFAFIRYVEAGAAFGADMLVIFGVLNTHSAIGAGIHFAAIFAEIAVIAYFTLLRSGTFTAHFAYNTFIFAVVLVARYAFTRVAFVTVGAVEIALCTGMAFIAKLAVYAVPTFLTFNAQIFFIRIPETLAAFRAVIAHINGAILTDFVIAALSAGIHIVVDIAAAAFIAVIIIIAGATYTKDLVCAVLAIIICPLSAVPAHSVVAVIIRKRLKGQCGK